MMWKQSRKYIFRGSWHVVDVSTLGARDRNKKKKTAQEFYQTVRTDYFILGTTARKIGFTQICLGQI